MDKRDNSLITRTRLSELKLRLDRVAKSWTVDNYESLLKFYVHILPRVFEAERCTIYIIEMGTDKISSMFGTGLKDQRIEPPREGSIVGKVISDGKGLVANGLDRRPGYHTLISEETGFVTRDMICTPIKSATGRGVIGAIQVLNTKNNKGFRADDLHLLNEAASHLSMSIENIVLSQEIFRISSHINPKIDQHDRGFLLDHLFIAKSEAMRDLLDLVKMVSSSPVNVLIQGENGTGKELIARLIHEASDRHDNNFIAVNCAAIPENLTESEFFGHEKGAFTGADRMKKGLLEEADGGTLMLDEIGDMPLSIQPKLLRAIQEGEGSRLGSHKLIKYNIRIISATNKNLDEEQKKGQFREDLFFRLFSVKLTIPPLRERKKDIVPLALAFLADTCTRFGKRISGFSSDVLNIFEDHSWPGNVRQLRSEIERLVALTPDGNKITPDKCSRELFTPTEVSTENIPSGPMPEIVRRLEINMIRKTLAKTSGNRQKTADLLGITRQGLHKKMKRYEIEPPKE